MKLFSKVHSVFTIEHKIPHIEHLLNSFCDHLLKIHLLADKQKVFNPRSHRRMDNVVLEYLLPALFQSPPPDSPCSHGSDKNVVLIGRSYMLSLQLKLIVRRETVSLSIWVMGQFRMYNMISYPFIKLHAFLFLKKCLFDSCRITFQWSTISETHV